MTPNEKKTQRQTEIGEKWTRSGGRGTVIAVTGFGKTRVATNKILAMNKIYPDAKTIVITPRIKIRKDWDDDNGHINSLGLKNVECYVVNGFLNKYNSVDKAECTLLVLDEIHNYAAETFYDVFQSVDYRYILGLTATLERKDGRHNLLLKHAPVIAEVTMQEAEREGYISEYKVYNLGVELSEEDKEYEKEVNDMFNKNFKHFAQDFDLAMSCTGSLKPRAIYDKAEGFKGWRDPPAVRYARELGWVGNSAKRAKEIENQNKLKKRGTKQDIWGGNLEFQYHPKQVSEYAQKFMHYMRERQNFLHSAKGKFTAIEELVKSFPDKKIIVFCERQDFADKIGEKLGSISRVYHSNISSEVYVQKTLIARSIKVNKVTKYKLLSDNKTYTWKEIKTKYPTAKRVGKDKIKERTIIEYEEDIFRVLITVKALDEGFNIEGADMGIIASSTSVGRQDDQRRGRIIRYVPGKVGIIVNLYVDGTKDKYWLIERQKKVKRKVEWIKKIKEINDKIENDEMRIA